VVHFVEKPFLHNALGHALHTFNCSADGWMNDKGQRLRAMLDAVL